MYTYGYVMPPMYDERLYSAHQAKIYCETLVEPNLSWAAGHLRRVECDNWTLNKNLAEVDVDIEQCKGHSDRIASLN